MRVTVPLALPNKANTYEIHFSSKIARKVRDIISAMASSYGIKGCAYWIGPSRQVKAIEEAIGYFAKQSLAEDTDGPVQLDVWISDKLDCDAVKAIGDGLQASGRLKNDRQIKILRVFKIPTLNREFSFDIKLLDGSQPMPDCGYEAIDDQANGC